MLRIASPSSRYHSHHGGVFTVLCNALKRGSGSATSSHASLSVSSSSSSSTFVRSFSTTESSSSPPSLRKVLIANRGEIACRVIRTCRQWGIPTVALYSVADTSAALHASMADEAYNIGTGPSPGDSYLLQNEILEIALQTGADAIHPGYGFLSENANFCQRVQEAGISFVGPPATAIHAMGSKSESKAIMEKAGVPTTPGYYGTGANPEQEQDPEFLRTQAVKTVGFPLLIKAVMGGGGKGMRIVWNESEFLAALESCQREAQSAVGDSTVLLEKYLYKPRHVEVQVIADSHGNVVHLNERDCSLQRRHQKIIEEAPASDLPLELRSRFGEMAKRAAQAVGYQNAGTVEFLLDTQTPDQFYFCEMNTRLQVEHPISEEITGIDLVEWQLRVAAGETLPITNQNDIPCEGHAFEARIYAENPARNFLPAAGRVWHHVPPTNINVGLVRDNDSSSTSSAGGGVRVDTGLQSGQDVGVYYDPMISKLIVHDQDRPRALQKLIQALQKYQIAGVPNNIDFLIRCAQHPTFQIAGAINTGFLDDFADDVHPNNNNINASTPPPALAQAVGSFAALLFLEQRIGKTQASFLYSSPSSPWSSSSGSWRMGGEAGRASRHLVLKQDETVVAAEEEAEDGTAPPPAAAATVECISNRDGSFDITTSQGQLFHISGHWKDDDETTDQTMQVVVNHTHRIDVATVLRVTEDGNNTIQVRMWPKSTSNNILNSSESSSFFWSVDIQHPLLPDLVTSSGLYGDSVGSSGAAAGKGICKAPMPGKISRILCQVGDTVEKNQTIMVMEAMKMEHAIKATRDGILHDCRHKAGDVVPDSAVLFTIVDPDHHNDPNDVDPAATATATTAA